MRAAVPRSSAGNAGVSGKPAKPGPRSASASRVLVAGGAGFIGSIVAQEFVRAGWTVTVVDGLLPGTGGRREHLKPVERAIEFVAGRVERVAGLPDLLAAQDLVVDCMGMTSHVSGLKKPLRDLQVNTASHVHLIQALPKGEGPRIVYLGTRVQYGKPQTARITKATHCQPMEPQGVSKLAAEGYYRAFAAVHGWNVVSLRLTNCFGEHQPLRGADLGLVGNCVRDLVGSRSVTVFGKGRRRNLVYVRDVAQIIVRLAGKTLRGFNVYNVAGTPVTIERMAASLVEIIGYGRILSEELPRGLRPFESGPAAFDDARLRRLVRPFPRTDLEVALKRTVEYFRENAK